MASKPEKARVDQALAGDIRLIGDWLSQCNKLCGKKGRAVPLAQTPIGRAVFARDDEGAIRFMRAYLTWRRAECWDHTLPMVDPLFRRNLPFTEDDLLFMVRGSAEVNPLDEWPVGPIVGSVERRLTECPVRGVLRRALERMLRALLKRAFRKSELEAIPRLQKLLGRAGSVP